MEKKEVFKKISDAILNGDTEVLKKEISGIIETAQPLDIIQQGMMPGLRKIGDLFGSGEVFLPEMLMAAEAFQEGMKIVEPKLISSGQTLKSLGKVVFGTVLTDIHEIGKNIVITLMRTHGFDVIDLGANVSPTTFVEQAEKTGADVIAMSSLMTTTMTYQRDVIEYLKERGLRDKYIVLVGGGPVNKEWADQIGADGTSDSAVGAVELTKKLISEKKGGK
ncbi:MAG: cobalamin B12-binding domain-containing protein [Spirochaetota bacterium]